MEYKCLNNEFVVMCSMSKILFYPLLQTIDISDITTTL